MATVMSQNSHLIPSTHKKYHTFQIVNAKRNRKAYPSGILVKIASFFEHSAPLSPSPSPSTTNDTISSHAELLTQYNNFPSQKTFYLFYFNILSCSISFTLIIPSLWSYLRELECTELYLAYCISIYAIGELCGSYLASIILNKYNAKFVLILSMFAGISGGFIYGTAGLVEWYFAPYSVLIGRIMQGIWTGMEQYTETKYLSDNVDLQKNCTALRKISLISSIGFILGPIIGILLQLCGGITLGFGFGWLYITIQANMLCGYFIMILCIIQLIVTVIVFDNKLRAHLPKRNTFTRTLTIQPRRDNTIYSTPRYTMTTLATDLSKGDINLTPPPKTIHIYKKKQLKKTTNGYSLQLAVSDRDDASPLSYSQKSIKSLKSNRSRKWLDSASPPSTLPCIPDNFDDYNYYYSEKNFNVKVYNNEEKEQSISTDIMIKEYNNKLKINIYDTELKELENKLESYRSSSVLSDQNTFHRTCVAEMLNIDTPTANCTPYTPHNTFNTTPFTPNSFNGYDNDNDTDEHQCINHMIGINNINNINNINSMQHNDNENKNKYIRTYTTFNKFASIVMTFCFLIHFEAFSIQQTMTSYLIKRKFDWDVYDAHYLFILCGIIWMLSFYLINKLLMIKSINHNSLVKVSLFFGVISTFCLISITLFPNIKYNEYLYIFGFILISFTFPFGRASVLSLYCLCTNYQYVAWIYLVSMISRIITPFIGICLYFTINGPSWMYGNITVLFMIAIILCSLTTSAIKKQKIPKQRNELNHGFSVINIPQALYVQK